MKLIEDLYNKNKVGKYLGSGAEYRVYRYGQDEIIKFSKLYWLIGKKLYQKAIKDYEICKRYF